MVWSGQVGGGMFHEVKTIDKTVMKLLVMSNSNSEVTAYRFKI